MRGAVALILAVAVVSGCGGKEQAQPDALTQVRGVVYRPAEGSVLDFYRPGDDLRGPPFTKLGPLAADGSYAIDLPPGEYVLVARKRSGGEETGPVREGDLKTDPLQVTVTAGRPLDINLLAYVKRGNPKESLGEEAGWKTSFAGVVRDPEGRAVAGVRVHVYDHVQMSERPKFVSAKTGPDGRYTVALPEGGTYYVCARDQYGGPPKVGDLYGRYDQGTVDPSAVIVPDGAAVQGVDIVVHTVW